MGLATHVLLKMPSPNSQILSNIRCFTPILHFGAILGRVTQLLLKVRHQKPQYWTNSCPDIGVWSNIGVGNSIIAQNAFPQKSNIALLRAQATPILDFSPNIGLESPTLLRSNVQSATCGATTLQTAMCNLQSWTCCYTKLPKQ